MYFGKSPFGLRQLAAALTGVGAAAAAGLWPDEKASA